MEYKIDKIPPEEEGDGLPNMRWRLRIILASIIGGSVAWVGIISLIR
jgi:hypothetical protein